MTDSREILSQINSPADVKNVSAGDLPLLAEEVRSEILQVTSRTGGHLASSLGAVELTIALLRVFAPPQDKIVWDVGHQTYAWKLLTGRREAFGTLRTLGGLSGFLKPSESACDATVTGHAGAALSSALGLAVARDRAGESSQVVAVVGDGCMANGISLEALNNLIETHTKVIVVLNDNERSISQNLGALSRLTGRVLSNVHYNRIKHAAEAAGHKLHMTFLRGLYHRIEQAIKSLWLKNSFYEEFGLRYIGPIDGHDFNALDHAFRSAAEYDRPVLLHVATVKGKGYRPAEHSPTAWHGVGPFPLDETAMDPPAGSPGYSAAFGEALCALAAEDPRVVAITAAMCSGTGLGEFSRRFPKRFFDAGICEEHATVFAAGLAAGGMRPFFAVYSTFLQRAVDCVMHDVCLAKLPVTFCIDRAGCVGRDGATHHGLYDIPMLRALPGLTILQPRSRAEMRAMMAWSLKQTGPVAIRYPKSAPLDTPEDAPVIDDPTKAEIVSPLRVGEGAGLWIWALGDRVARAQEVAARLAEKGVRAGVVNARAVKPLDVELLRRQAAETGRIVTIENGAVAGGFGSAVREALAESSCRVESFGWPDAQIPHGSVDELEEAYGLTAEAIAATVSRESRSA